MSDYSLRRFTLERYLDSLQKISKGTIKPTVALHNRLLKYLCAHYRFNAHLGLCSSRRFGIKWRLPDYHFVQDNSNGPPVARLSVSLLQQDFRRDVVRGTDERVSHTPLLKLLSTPAFERLHAVSHVWTWATPVLEVLHINRIHGVLAVMVASWNWIESLNCFLRNLI